MSMSNRRQQATDQVTAAIAKARGLGGPQVGTMVDLRSVRLRDCGGCRADVIIGGLEAVASASERSDRFRQLSRALRSDGSIDLWIPSLTDPWRTAVFRLSVEPGLTPSDLILAMTTHIPFGLGNDASAYPIETSTAYRRPTQSLYPVANVHARMAVRSTIEDGSVTERSETNSQASEQSQRQGVTQSFSNSHTHGHSNTTNDHPWPGKEVHSEYWSNEKRAEAGGNTEQQSAWTDSRQSSSAQSSTQRRTAETTREVTQDISFVAVGIDFSDSERLWKSWRADPKNRDLAVSVELMLGSLGSLADFMSERTRARRLEARNRPDRLLGNELSDRFWAEAESFVPIDQSGNAWVPTVLGHDGRALPIGPDDHARALREAWPYLQSASKQYQRLVE